MKHNLSAPTKYLLTAVGSVLFVNAALPIIDSLSGLVQSTVNVKINKMQMELEEANAEHQAAVELIKPNNGNATNAIGFSVPSEEEYYEDD